MRKHDLLLSSGGQVRRAQLKQLLEEECRGYEAELHDMGLALHKDRT